MCRMRPPGTSNSSEEAGPEGRLIAHLPEGLLSYGGVTLTTSGHREIAGIVTSRISRYRFFNEGHPTPRILTKCALYGKLVNHGHTVRNSALGRVPHKLREFLPEADWWPLDSRR